MRAASGSSSSATGRTEITAHFTGPPFYELELQHPGIHTVVHSYDLLGGRTTSTLVWATSRFRTENPKTFAAFFAALEEATNWINSNKRAAPELYVRLTRTKESADGVYKILNEPDIAYTLSPENVTKYADFMHKVGSIKTRQISWKEMFFPEVYGAGGS